MTLSPVEAAELLLKRREIRKSFTAWCRVAGYEPAPHHQLLISKLEAVARGEIKRLAVFMPPGSAKSTYASVLFPASFLAQNPKANIIAASHTSELADQQRPVPDTGDYFKAEWLKSVDILPAPETIRTYGGSDFAVTSNGGDYTCHVVVGLDPQGRMYLLDLWRERASSDAWIESFCDLVKKW